VGKRVFVFVDTVRLVPDVEPEFPELLRDGGNDLGRHTVPGVR
jgi:hypothetical protein